MSFRFFSSKDWNGCADVADYVQSKSEGGLIEDWDYLGLTDDDDWDLGYYYKGEYIFMRMDTIFPVEKIRELTNSGKYVVLRKHYAALTPENILILQVNGEIKRGGNRHRFRCVKQSSPKRSPKKRCPAGSRKNKQGECVKSPKKPLPETTAKRVASPKKTSPTKSNNDAKSEDTCYMFNDIKFCEPTRVGYRETQQEQRCGLHAYNNLFQNQTKVEKPQILTKEKMDEYCSLVQSNTTQVKVCNEYGYYYSDVLIRAINAEVKDVHVYYDNSFQIQTVAKLNQILNQEKFVGALYLYKAPGMENHWVTLLPRENKFLVVDSHKFNQKLHIDSEKYVHNALVQIDRGNAEVLDSAEQVRTYFRNFLGMIIVMHTKKLPRCPSGTRKDKNGHCKADKSRE